MSGSRYFLTWFSLVFVLYIHIIMAVDIERFKRFTKDDVCSETVSTLKNVTTCPKGQDYKERSEKKSCERYPQCKGKPLVYHCVKLEEEYVEVCAPRDQITGRCCAVFDRRLGRVREDYNLPCAECPFKYQSDDSLKYASCFKRAQISSNSPKLNYSTNTTDSSNISGTTSSPCCKGKRCKRNVNGCTEHKFHNNERESESYRDEKKSSLEYIIPTLTLVIMLICAAVIIPYSCYRIYRNNKDKADNSFYVGLIENGGSVT